MRSKNDFRHSRACLILGQSPKGSRFDPRQYYSKLCCWNSYFWGSIHLFDWIPTQCTDRQTEIGRQLTVVVYWQQVADEMREREVSDIIWHQNYQIWKRSIRQGLNHGPLGQHSGINQAWLWAKWGVANLVQFSKKTACIYQLLTMKYIFFLFCCLYFR